MAREAGISKFHLLRLFKAVFGCTPSAYAQSRRVERALHMLEQGWRSLENIAENVGYADSTSLIRAVRRHTGETPAAYRRQFSNRG